MKITESISAKYFLLVFVLSILFVFIIIKAFSYIPEKGEPQIPDELLNPSSKKEQVQEDDNDVESEDVQIEESVVDNNLSIKKENSSSDDIEEIEVVEDGEAENVALKDDGEVREFLIKASDAKQEGNYSQAIADYLKASEITNNVRIKADCYENIANLYAVLRKYGSALSYAQNANSIEQTTSREVLIAKLYYKTGQTEKATNKINNFLRRDFIIE